ncbi:MAG: LysR family transcriptional regulator [Candidatus Sericytochromatia bacterium]
MHAFSSLSSLSLDQLLLFVTVAEAGSFSAAARRLERVQSTVSHGIAQLEKHLDVRLFDRSARTPRLTPAGAHLLQHAQGILGQLRQLQNEAQLLQSGHEAFVSLVVDMIVPVDILTRSLKAVQKSYPTVRWLLHTEMLGAITQRVLDGSCQLGLSGQLQPQHRSKLEHAPVGRVDFVFVAAPQHPLAQLPGPLTDAQWAQHTHLAVADRGEMPYPVGERWFLGDLHTLLHCAKESFGWAFLPLHLVADALASGELVQLIPATRPALHPFPIYSLHLKSDPPGPVRLALLQAFEQAFAARTS